MAIAKCLLPVHAIAGLGALLADVLVLLAAALLVLAGVLAGAVGL